MRLAFVRLSLTILVSICISAFAVDAIQTKAPELTEVQHMQAAEPAKAPAPPKK